MDFIKKLNHWVFQAERAIVVVSLLVMSVVVFASVVYRRYADPDSILAEKIARLIGAERDSATWDTLQSISGPLAVVLLGVLLYLGFRTASRRPLWNRGDETGKSHAEIHGEPRPHLHCLGYTAATLAVSYGVLVVLFGTGNIEQATCIELEVEGKLPFACGRFPTGLNWAQPFALILTLWVSFVGASMATSENLHLKVEAVQHALPERIQRVSGLISGILTAGFCLLLAYLAAEWALNKHEEYEIANGLGGLHDGIDIPYFMTFTIVPIAYSLMAVRFVGLGVLAFRGELEDTPAELRDLDLPKDDPFADEEASIETIPGDPPELDGAPDDSKADSADAADEAAEEDQA
ncbi:hypothetical protein PPSIR1_38736 [Plesiocystis pacifica SIR-1]|uniref:Tripartite ATP-independent periplasmic transporters DctQ component domain-containing protein n=1 Tax=Plesiocystis pacifica SIR-1 TaxID=391625 RepID=A6G8S0_9BACT|nr:TRAP transporter small permease subunit [Plesiocystis pacifica]EDM77730.1 hypothetical protein PPSIR1_38736 [Plesiocystis pacifica SIR-1]